MLFVLLAPGPSMSKELAERVRAQQVGVVTSAYPLAPWATFLAATDHEWWRKNPQAKQFTGHRYTPWNIPGTEQVRSAIVSGRSNSGVLALECAVRLGATRILMLGFDHSGTHYFGPYTNGLSNTTPARRNDHAAQYALWQRAHPQISVKNCTTGSALNVFPLADLEEELS
jgi:hypothetical protein